MSLIRFPGHSVSNATRYRTKGSSVTLSGRLATLSGSDLGLTEGWFMPNDWTEDERRTGNSRPIESRPPRTGQDGTPGNIAGVESHEGPSPEAVRRYEGMRKRGLPDHTLEVQQWSVLLQPQPRQIPSQSRSGLGGLGIGVRGQSTSTTPWYAPSVNRSPESTPRWSSDRDPDRASVDADRSGRGSTKDR